MGGFGSLSKAATAAILNISEWSLLLGGVVLVIGLVGELKTDDKCTDAQKLWYKRFEWAVIIGVAIELLADGGVFFASRRLQTISDAEIVSANARIVRLAPRFWLLTPEVADSMSSELRAFKGQKVAIVVNSPIQGPYDDSQILAERFLSMLDEAGWLAPSGQPIFAPDPQHPSQRLSAVGVVLFSTKRLPSNILTETAQSPPARTGEASQKLGHLLADVSIDIGWSQGFMIPLPDSTASTNDLVIVLIGEKTTS
jgi:hypothetical protein